MVDLTDEELMQFADRTLSAAEEGRVEKILAENPGARARLAAFIDTAPDGAVFAPLRAVASGPPPARLVEAIMQAPAAPVRAAARGPQRSSVQGMLDGLFSFGKPRWAPAFAMMLLAVGGVVGWVLHGASSRGAPGMLALEGGRLVAQGELLRALETSRSGELVSGAAPGSAAAVKVRLTFKSQEDGYCRQYDLSTAAGATFSGIGCRAADGAWQIRLHVPTKADATATDRLVPVGDGKAMIAGLVGAMSTDDPLDTEQESGLLSRRWRP